MILLIVVTMMQVVCCDKQTKKESKKKRKSRPFCTGCLYVWEEILKINADTVVNTKRKVMESFFFITFFICSLRRKSFK